jgi:hypothetical protein
VAAAAASDREPRGSSDPKGHPQLSDAVPPRIRWAIPGVVLALVLVLSLWTDVSLGSDLREFLAHAAAYAAAATSLLAVGRPSGDRTGWSTGGAAGIGLLLVGVGLVVEVGQLWVGRDADPLDVLADASGVGVALGIWFLLRSGRRTRTARRQRGRLAVRLGRKGGIRTTDEPADVDPLRSARARNYGA